ncbi:MAG: murB [Rhodospirillales bacterium]|nr:murB [Rhodospirillales bacterium]
MMAAQRLKPDLADHLPPVRGRIRAGVALAPLTWFRVGGPAQILFRPADIEDLAAFLTACPVDISVTTLGVASNLLVRDGGLSGVVIRLGGEFARVRIDGAKVVAGAGALDLTVAEEALATGLAGLEFLSGIPGTIGGAVRMNAGAYGSEIVDIIESAVLVTRAGKVVTIEGAALGLSYRHSTLPEGAIVVEATLRGREEQPELIAERMRDIQARRAETQPIRSRTGGSTFANPPGAKAWELIDRAGCRGLTLGGAQVSEQHCNFLINTGAATAADLESLGEEVRRRVRGASGIDLSWEIMRIGAPR